MCLLYNCAAGKQVLAMRSGVHTGGGGEDLGYPPPPPPPPPPAKPKILYEPLEVTKSRILSAFKMAVVAQPLNRVNVSRLSRVKQGSGACD